MTPGPRGAADAELERLRRLTFFQDLTRAEVRQVVRLGRRRAYESAAVLATEGTRKQRRSLYVVLAGQIEYVRRVRGEQTSVPLRLAPGDVGGFLTFFNDDPSPVSVRSAGPSEVLEIGRDAFQRLMAQRPELAAKLLFALLRVTVAHTEALMNREAAIAGWLFELEYQVRQLPVVRGR